MLAVVLSRHDIRESDQRIVVYTKDAGKMELIAKGVKKITSKNSAHLEPFSLIDVGVADGKESDYITFVHSVLYYSELRTDLMSARCAHAVVSLVESVTRVGAADERVFVLLLTCLDGVAKYAADPNYIDWFVINVLHLMGHGPMEDNTYLGSYHAIMAAWVGHPFQAIPLSLQESVHAATYAYACAAEEKALVKW